MKQNKEQHPRYHADPASVSLDVFRKNLASRELLSSRAFLKENLTERFRVLESAGVHTLDDLMSTLKTRQKIEAFAFAHGLDAEYLTVLRREAGSYFPSPVALDKFPGVAPNIVSSLRKQGITTSKQLFELAASGAEKKISSLIDTTDATALDDLVSLSDLVRLYGVGPKFARLLFDIGIRSVSRFLQYTPEEVVRLYETSAKKKADFTLRDIEFSMQVARDHLPNSPRVL